MSDPSQTHESITYGSYLKLEELLSLQVPRSDGPEHDETLFIIIHQVYELWFKQVLHEMALLQHALEEGARSTALATFKRVLTILKILVAQVDILETMTPVSFASFRSRLEAASGFQSAQFRELEFVLGARHRGKLEHYPPGSEARRRLEAVLTRPTLYDSFLRYLASLGHTLPGEVMLRTVRDPDRARQESPAVQEVLIRIYREDPDTREVCERLVDLDEGFQEWRYRHVKMVERTIGTKPGTGGSPGASYLRTTLFKPFFPDLWAIRASL